MSQTRNFKEDPCDLLGLPRDSSIEIVRRARRELSNKAHPDKSNNSSHDPLEIAALQDLLKRVNANLVQWEQCIREGRAYLVESEFATEEDPFADLEEKKRNLREQSQSKYALQNGEDIKIRREIDLSLALASRLVKIKISGELKSSVITDKPFLEIRIPPNFVAGQTLKLKGKGKPGLFGGTPGDLYVTLVSKKPKVTPQPSPSPQPQPTPSPQPQPTPSPEPQPDSGFIEDTEEFDSAITPVDNMGSQIWWKLAIGTLATFVLATLVGWIDYSTQQQVKDPSEEQVNQTIVTDDSNSGFTQDSDYEPVISESDAGATGELDDPVTSSSEEEPTEGDIGVTGEIGNP